MPFPGAVDKIEFFDGPIIVKGPHVTRATVAAEFRTAPIGSIYISIQPTGNTGRIYLKITESGGASGTATDWQKITTSAAD